MINVLEGDPNYIEDQTESGVQMREMLKQSMTESEYEAHDMDHMIRHLHGIPWHAAPVPRRFHRCWAQTVGYVNLFWIMERCACGALRRDGDRWENKNSRRRQKLVDT